CDSRVSVTSSKLRSCAVPCATSSNREAGLPEMVSRANRHCSPYVGQAILPAAGFQPASRLTLKPALRTISRPSLHPILLRHIGWNLNRNLAEPFVGIRLRIVSDRVRVPEVFADRLESFDLLLPIGREVRLASGARRDPLEDVRGNGVLVHFVG